jgi:tight adherence protein B
MSGHGISLAGVTNSLDSLLILIFVGVLVAGMSLVFAFGGPDAARQRQREKAARLRRRFGADAKVGAPLPSVKRKEAGGRANGWDRFLWRTLPNPEALRLRLLQSGRNLSIGGYALGSAGIGIVGFGLSYAVFGFAPLPSLLILVAAGIGIPHFLLSHLIRRRIKRFTELFPDAIDLIVRGLKSGLPAIESIAAVAMEFADPVGREFRRVRDEVRLGRSLEEALWEAAKRMDTPEFRFFVISLAVQRETGGNLAETLENLSDILRRRRQMGIKVQAMSSEARASAYIIGSLPFVMFAILYLVNTDYVLTLFSDPRGVVMLGAGLASMAIGALVMMKMVHFEI